MPVLPQGKEFTIVGVKRKLYPISVLAERLSEALGDERTAQTIRKWETKGIIPPATFRVGKKRYYAEEQIKVICKVAKEENIRQGVSLSLTMFSQRVREELKEVNKILLAK